MFQPGALGDDAAFAGRADLGSTPLGRFVGYWVRDGQSLTAEQGEDAGVRRGLPHHQLQRRPPRDPGALFRQRRRRRPPEDGPDDLDHLSGDGRRQDGRGDRADLALDDIATRLNALKPFDDGRAMLVSPKGLWVSHPDAAMRMKAYADPGLDVVRKAMADGRPAVVEGVRIKGRPAQRLVTPVRLASGATWAMVVDVLDFDGAGRTKAGRTGAHQALGRALDPHALDHRRTYRPSPCGPGPGSAPRPSCASPRRGGRPRPGYRRRRARRLGDRQVRHHSSTRSVIEVIKDRLLAAAVGVVGARLQNREAFDP